MGNYNARIGNTAVAAVGVKERFYENVLNENGELTSHFSSYNELRINNTHYDRKEQYKYPFESTYKSK
jgi:hypothetical protein